MKNIKKLEKSTEVLKLDLTNLNTYLMKEGIYENNPYSKYILHLNFDKSVCDINIVYDKEMIVYEEYIGNDYLIVQFDTYEESVIVELNYMKIK